MRMDHRTVSISNTSSRPLVRAFVQARMSSQRFPGKVLAPFRNEPIIVHVLRAVERVLDRSLIVVATSVEPSDDPLWSYLNGAGYHVFRGPLSDVFERFRLCLGAFPADWIMRISADSPLLQQEPVEKVVGLASRQDCDLVTTIFPRTFPRGSNAELIRTETFLCIDPSQLTAHDREHVTPFYYRNADRFRIVNVTSHDPDMAELSLAVETIEDLQNLDRLSQEVGNRLSHTSLQAVDGS